MLLHLIPFWALYTSIPVTFSVHTPTHSHHTKSGSDIYLNTTSLMLTGSQREYTIQCVIVNNDIPEEVERAVLRVVAASDNELDYNLEPSGFIIDINDDDGIPIFLFCGLCTNNI